MAYTILNADGTTLLLLADNITDKVTTSLDLVGRNVNSYGQSVNNNFVKLLENFASSASTPPRSPLVGQLWYNTTNRRLNIYDNGFKSVSGALVAAAQPTIISSGDFWWDTVNEQLRVFNGTQNYLVGPLFPKEVGETGWVLPAVTINDDENIPQQVTLLRNHGQFVGMMSNAKFDMTTATSQVYFNTSTTATVVSGLTIDGDIRFTGQMTDRHLSAGVNIEIMARESSNVRNYPEYIIQNTAISAMLEKMFPFVASVEDDEVGVPMGSECRVNCDHNLPGLGMQVRRFRVANTGGSIGWKPYEVYPYTFADNGLEDSNIMYEIYRAA
jgi:hypothetical protein